MNIVRGYPPNFHEIVAVFPAARTAGVIFTYGSTAYNTGPHDLTPALEAHEAVHSRQQGADPAGWWASYLTSANFRFSQELEAHREEYRVAIDGANRNQRRVALKAIATRLAGPLYGKVVSLKQAKNMIWSARQ